MIQSQPTDDLVNAWLYPRRDFSQLTTYPNMSLLQKCQTFPKSKNLQLDITDTSIVNRPIWSGDLFLVQNAATHVTT